MQGHDIIWLLAEVRGSDRGTSFRGLPWVLPQATVEIRGFPRQGPRLSIVHVASTASATVVTMARATVLSVATSVVRTMAAHGSTTATATAYSMATSIP